MRPYWSFFVKKSKFLKILWYLNFEKNGYFAIFKKKKKSRYPPKSWPILTKFLLGILHIMNYLHVKFHQNRSTLSTQNCLQKSNIRPKIPKKLSLSLRYCQNVAGTYEPWAEIPLGNFWWCSEKIWWPWKPFLGVK